MKTLLFVIFVGCSLLAGYYSGLQKRVAVQADLKKELLKSNDLPLKRSLAFAITVATEEKMRQSGKGLSDISVLNSALDRSMMTDHESELAKALGNDEAGAKLRRFLIADHHEAEVPGSHLLVSRFLDELKANPELGLSTLQSALDKIPPAGFPLERASLLLTMNDVVEKSDTIKTSSLNELVTNVVPSRPDPQTAQSEEDQNQALSTSAEMMLPIVAHEVFMKNTTDSGEAMNGTVEGIAAQPDKGVKIAIASQFLDVYPAMKNDLIAALNAKGVDSPIQAVGNGP
jgi:hypothetical protein